MLRWRGTTLANPVGRLLEEFCMISNDLGLNNEEEGCVVYVHVEKTLLGWREGISYALLIL